MRVVEELRGRVEAVSVAATKAWNETSEHPEADTYEAYAGLLGAVTLGSADITYKIIEAGSPVTGRDALISLGATILSSVGAMIYYGKSRDARQEP